MLRDHGQYVDALRSIGATVHELPPPVDFPDAVFVEDTALCLPGFALLMRPGAPSRAGEVAYIAPPLNQLFDVVRPIEGPGHIEGGDILFTGRELLVGLSCRTDVASVAELRALLARHAASGGVEPALRCIDTPPGVLHFKTDCSLLGDGTLLATERLARTGCFVGYRVIRTPDGEEAAANCMRFNELVPFRRRPDACVAPDSRRGRSAMPSAPRSMAACRACRFVSSRWVGPSFPVANLGPARTPCRLFVTSVGPSLNIRLAALQAPLSGSASARHRCVDSDNSPSRSTMRPKLSRARSTVCRALR